MNTMVKWHCQPPLSALAASDQLDAVLSRFFQPTQQMQRVAKIPLEVREDNTQYFIEATIAGVKKEDIHLTVDKHDVTMEVEARRADETTNEVRTLLSERQLGKASRAFSLAHEIDDTKVQARYADGVLYLVLPKRIDAAAKQITIN
jgi:HSP20 family protein